MTVVCPYCQGVANLLSVLSSVSPNNFFECADCYRVSEVAKGAKAPPAPVRTPSGPPPDLVDSSTSSWTSGFSIVTSTDVTERPARQPWRRTM